MRKQDCQLTAVFAVPQKISHSDASHLGEKTLVNCILRERKVSDKKSLPFPVFSPSKNDKLTCRHCLTGTLPHSRLGTWLDYTI